MRSLVGRAKRGSSRSLVEQLASLTSSGDGSTLSLDFTTGVLDQRLSFSRSTNATFINSQGLVQYADANMMTGSENLDPALYGWGAQNGATCIFDTSVADPNGILGTPRLASSPTIGSAAVNSSALSVASGITYTLTFWIRAGTASTFLVGLFETSAFAPATGTILSGPGSISGTGAINISGLTSAWTKVRIYITPAVTAANRAVSFYPQGAQSGGLTNYVWGVQFNIGQTPNPTYFKTVATAYQAPRFDYDPTTLAPRGLLIEGSANNLMTYSEDQGNNTTWNAFGTSVTRTTGQTDPGNNSTATKLVFDATTADAVISRSVTVLNATQYTISMWMRADSGTVTNVRFARAAGSAGAIFPTLTTAWQRVQLTFTSSTTSDGIEIRVLNSGSPQTATVHLWGAQLEVGSGASSYIPTGAGTVNRAADSCVMTGTNFSSWFAGATEGVFYAEYEAPRSLGTADYFCLGTVYAVGTFIGMNLANSTRYPQASISPGGGFRISSGISVAASTPMKHAAKWSGASNVLVFANGAVGTAHPATSGTPTFTMFSIGSSSTSGTAATGDYLNACVRRVKFWPVALPDSRIISITT